MTHQYRCDENCKYFESKVDDANKSYLYCNKAKGNIHYSWRMMSSVNGCASHSDFHPYNPQAERERVLDEQRPCKTPKDCEHRPKFTMDCLVNVQEHFKELRQEGKGGE